MKKYLLLFAFPVLLALMASCTSDDDGGRTDGELTPITPANIQVQQTEFAQQSNKFAGKLLEALSSLPENKDQNICVAPMSMQYMLSMLANATELDGRQKILEALGIDNIEELNAQNLALLNKLDQDKAYVEVGISNAMWLEKDFEKYKDSYKSLMEQYYKAGMYLTDFKNNSEAVKQQINKWASDNTKKLITNVPLNINKRTAFVVANANYFDGKWANPFNPSYTKSRPFYNIDNTQKDVMTMSNSMVTKSFEDDSLQMAELPYGQGYYSMIVVMPKYTEALDSLAACGNWWAWHQQMTVRETSIRLPRFAATLNCNKMLGVMNDLIMPEFDQYDFEGIHPFNSFWLTSMVHSTVINVDENGTKAASVSAGGGICTSPGLPLSIAFDHPFIYAIRENTTGAILFMGKVVKL